MVKGVGKGGDLLDLSLGIVEINTNGIRSAHDIKQLAVFLTACRDCIGTYCCSMPVPLQCQEKFRNRTIYALNRDYEQCDNLDSGMIPL